MIFQLSRPGLDLQHHHDDDNELLFQEQKSCRARARKFSLETNRRRKALEERRRQWDVQEQLLRENILQQRKQRLLEDTERFQRAHLPPSQKRRPVNLDEALSHIHGALGSYAYQSSFLSSASNLSRWATLPFISMQLLQIMNFSFNLCQIFCLFC
uniref:Uncharacterized protein n=1 Tax=Electrophorus electricus TaxID=8005 RepID=A0AAY5EN30_ELEEL